MRSFTLNFNITNTFFSDSFKHLGVGYGQITNNKFWELEHFLDPSHIFLTKVSYKAECDHAGLEIMVALLGYNISFRTYDCRHWNEEQNCWETYFS